jgi:hypothetical protein
MNYQTEFQQYNTSFKIVANCNVITFVNQGAATVYINNYPLVAGGNIQVAGNPGEVDKTEYRVNMGTTSGSVWVIRKVDQVK